MWRKDGVIYNSHQGIREAVRGKSLPAQLSDEVIAREGFTEITLTSKPVFDGLTEAADSSIVGDTQQWTVRSKTAEETAAMRAGMKVTRLQARLALIDEGLWDSIQPLIDAIPDATARAKALAFFEDAQNWERMDATVVMLAGGLGLTDQQVDELFIAAAGN